MIGHVSQPSTSTAMNEISTNEIVNVLNQNSKFRNILASKLNLSSVPSHTELLHMVRILCDHFFGNRIREQHDYPKTQEKKLLAERIIEAFPQLARPASRGAPAESMFFFKHNGQSKGTHRGYIEQRICNIRKEVPKENRMFNRNSQNTTSDIVSDDIVAAADLCSALDASFLNSRQISILMKTTFVIHSNLLKQKASVSQIFLQFPHFKSYHGLMVQQAFNRINQIQSMDTNIRRLLSKGLLLNRNAFTDVEDDYIRGSLILMKEMVVRGAKRAKEDASLSTDEIFAAPLVRWINVDKQHTHLTAGIYPPHIACFGKTKGRGIYFVVLEREAIDCGDCSIQTLDVFFKSFAVFGVKVPVFVYPLYEIFKIKIHKLATHSARNTVNNVLKALDNAERAEELNQYTT
ncbi:uncharacterized protein LOC131693447 isoform X3 [Topomyia yanbarensis]|uniref:uncharacterized protein LOC131693447 isoform X3 n=1 Tax=Topomyia yanbarensis TaxID=2498891 RepID=UPI00273B2A36|nr:uncharacterized protein LOC131693447 isoform X3 [Topomyia yanbarensis]